MTATSPWPAISGMQEKERELGYGSPTTTPLSASLQSVISHETDQTKLIKSYCEKLGKDICRQIRLVHKELLAVESRVVQQLAYIDPNDMPDAMTEYHLDGRAENYRIPGMVLGESADLQREHSLSLHGQCRFPSQTNEVKNTAHADQKVQPAKRNDVASHSVSNGFGKQGPTHSKHRTRPETAPLMAPGESCREYAVRGRPGTAPGGNTKATVGLLDDHYANAAPGGPRLSETQAAPRNSMQLRGASAGRPVSPPKGPPPPLPPIPKKLPSANRNALPADSSEDHRNSKGRRGSKENKLHASNNRNHLFDDQFDDAQPTMVHEMPQSAMRHDSATNPKSRPSLVAYDGIESPREDAEVKNARAEHCYGNGIRSSLRSEVSYRGMVSPRDVAETEKPRTEHGNGVRSSMRSEVSYRGMISPRDEAETEKPRNPWRFSLSGWTSKTESNREVKRAANVAFAEEVDQEDDQQNDVDLPASLDQEKKEQQPFAPVNKRFSTLIHVRGKSDVMRLSQTELSACGHYLRLAVTSPWFEYGVGVLLALNAISIGYRAEFRANDPSRKLPSIFITLELGFGVLFTLELVARICVYGSEFLRMKGWQWNAFDLFVIALQFVDVAFDAVGAAVGDGDQTKNLSILKILRLGRIVRLLRMVRLIPELKSMVYLIAASMASFLWTLVLLALLMFGVAVHFTEVVADYRETKHSGLGNLQDAWGTLMRSVTTLYQAILGGIDWKECMDELGKVNWSLTAVFAMYIAFASLVMLNLVTGVFVEGAQRIVAEDRDTELVRQAKRMFDIVDDSEDNQVSWQEFQRHLEDKGMAEYFRLVGISRKEAKDLFQLLDHDHSGTLSIKEFVHGCLGLRGPAKSLDLARLAYNHELATRRLMRLEELVRDELSVIAQHTGMITDHTSVLMRQTTKTQFMEGRVTYCADYS